MKPADALRRISGGESATLEFKKSTAQLNRAGERLCAFLNGDRGSVIVGVNAGGTIGGWEVFDRTRREIVALLDRFEPPPPIDLQHVHLPGGKRKLIVLRARSQGEAGPFFSRFC